MSFELPHLRRPVSSRVGVIKSEIRNPKSEIRNPNSLEPVTFPALLRIERYGPTQRGPTFEGLTVRNHRPLSNSSFLAPPPGAIFFDHHPELGLGGPRGPKIEGYHVTHRCYPPMRMVAPMQTVPGHRVSLVSNEWNFLSLGLESNEWNFLSLTIHRDRQHDRHIRGPRGLS